MRSVRYESLSWQDRRRVREEYIEEQKGLCYWCGFPLNERPTEYKKIDLRLFPPNFLKYPVHLHHDHVTGMTIGAVHAECNAVLWQYHGE